MSVPLRFMVAFQPGPGHWSRMGAIASVLRQRGHHVTIATSRTFRDRVDGAYDEFLAIGPSWKEDQLAAGKLSGTDSFADEGRDRGSEIASYFFGAAGEVAADLRAAFRDQPKFDLLVSDYTLLGAPPTAEALGIPWAAVFGLSVPLPCKAGRLLEAICATRVPPSSRNVIPPCAAKS